MRAFWKSFLEFFSSLTLTVVLLAASIILVFWATLAQVKLGVWGVQEQFFRTPFVLGYLPNTSIPVPLFPGGYVLGPLLLINLLAAHVYHGKFLWRKLGIHLTHFGLVLLLLGELFTSLWQEEFQLRLNEGETKSYAESYRNIELAVIDRTDPKMDDVVAIPEKILARGEPVQHGALPFRVVPKAYYPNAALQMRANVPNAPASLATQGIGTQIVATPLPLTYKENERNVPAAFVELVGAEGSLGTWLVSPVLGAPQRFNYAGHDYQLTLRFERAYKPFSLTLLKFSHDVYPGTDIPKNFSSRVKVTTPDGRDNREVLIYMNNPLRYAGLTFYQSGYEGEHTTILQVVRNPSWVLPYVACVIMALGLVIQFGLSLLNFVRRRRAVADGEADVDAGGMGRARLGPGETNPPRAERTAHLGVKRAIPFVVLLVGVAMIGSSLRTPKNPDAFDVQGFSRLPILVNGRVKPLDTVARTSLLVLQGRQRVGAPNSDLTRTPQQWLLDVLFDAQKANTYPTFEIDHPDVLSLVGRTEESLAIHYETTAKRVMAVFGFLPSRQRRFSFNDLQPHFEAIDRQAGLAEEVEPQARSSFQKAVVQLRSNLALYTRLQNSLVLPDSDNFLGDLTRFQATLPAGAEAVRARQAGKSYDEDAFRRLVSFGERFDRMSKTAYLLAIPMGDTWVNAGDALLDTFRAGEVHPGVLTYAGLAYAWRKQDAKTFNEIVRLYRAQLEKQMPQVLKKTDVEARFNASEPFYQAMTLYVIAFFVAVASWLLWPTVLGRSAFWLVALAFVLTTAGIGVRMWLEGRPPVTNLYSSALFVGWGAVALCLVLEAIYKNAIGSVAAGAVGFGTLLIAHHLALGGDTMEMMRAVLDSNFWLATHVVVVTTGYAATFLAGFLAIIYVVRGLFTRSLDKGTAAALARMVYGIVCFATLFSLVGTILGGIWADQSWGRFWGWDPKENGALIIVLWNAIILHARWGGLVKQRGLMILAIFGNVVTSWSWFGTNMLGVGLHSYGFMEAAFWWLIGFIASQLLLIALANRSLEKWRSFRALGKTSAAA